MALKDTLKSPGKLFGYGLVIIVLFIVGNIAWSFLPHMTQVSHEMLADESPALEVSQVGMSDADQQPAVDSDQTTDVPVTEKDKAIALAWAQALKATPVPEKNGMKGEWKPRAVPTATGETGCKPGETRVNPKTGRLQGCR